MLTVGIGVSTKLDPEEAGKEAVSEMLLSFKKVKPQFILLFSTITYDKVMKNGIKKLVNASYQTFDEVPMIGGTVSGFITNKDLFVDGVVAIGFYSSDLKVSYGIGEGVKKDPKKATKKCAEMIKDNKINGNYATQILFNFISGAIIPKIPFFGRFNYIKSHLVGEILSYVGLRIAGLLGTGIGKEEDVLDELASQFPDFYFFGGTTVDDFRYNCNYQFLNGKIYTNSIVSLAVFSNIKVLINGKIIGKKYGKSYKITKKMYDDRIIKEIEHVSANRYYFKKILNIDKKLFHFKSLETFYYRTSIFLPLGFDGLPEYSTGTGAILGKNILLGYKAKGDDIHLISVSGKDIIEVLENLNNEARDNRFVLWIGSGIPILILRNNAFLLHKILIKNNKYNFLMPLLTNEHYKLPFHEPIMRVYSFNYLGVKDE